MRPVKFILFETAALFLLALSLKASGGAKPSDVRHVLLITLDTTRADHIGCYGYAMARTPHLDGLAGQGVQFLSAYAHAPQKKGISYLLED